MLERTKVVYILANSTKLGDSYSSFWTPFPETWTLITDSGATESQLSAFRTIPGIKIHSSQPSVLRVFWPAALSLIAQRPQRVFSLFASRIQPKYAAAPPHQSLTWRTSLCLRI
jgi:hypothetical protein